MMATHRLRKVGMYVSITGSIEVPDGTYRVVELSERSSSMRVPRFHPSSVRVFAPSKRNREWSPAEWWIEDAAISDWHILPGLS